MSKALVKKAGIRWWSEEELRLRDMFFNHIRSSIEASLLTMNRAWEFQRCESPTIVPHDMTSPEYTEDEVFFTKSFVLRPETTAGSYKYAEHIFNSTKAKMPLCVYQMGKSYRVEKADGASPSKYRYNEFTQAEWQCIYSEGTMANYKEAVLKNLRNQVEWLLGNAHIETSDRLPSYSSETTDIMTRTQKGDIEVASVSIRNDYPGAKVLEIAFGMDRLVDIRMTQI